jgi:hypothetical protein
MTADVEGGFCFLAQLLDAENDMDIGHVVEMALETFELVLNITAEGIGDIQVAGGQINLHVLLLCRYASYLEQAFPLV